MKTGNLLKVLNEVRLRGGVSYNLSTGEMNPNTGYMVAKQGFEKKVNYVDGEVLSDYVISHAGVLTKENHWLGVWFDGNQFVLDISENVPTKRMAVFYALLRKQEAIWDCAKQDEFKIKLKKR